MKNKYNIEILPPVEEDSLENETVVFIDFDGVVNALTYLSSWDDEKMFKQRNTSIDELIEVWGINSIGNIVENYDIAYSPKIIDKLNELFKDVKVVWLTTWRDTVADPLLKMGLNIENHTFLPWEGRGGSLHFNHHVWGKTLALKEFLDKTNPKKVIWIDDDVAARVLKDLSFSKFDEFFPQENLLAISPNKGGLRLEMLKMMEDFINGDIEGMNFIDEVKNIG